METNKTPKAWYESLLVMDRRVIYALVMVVVAIPLFRPIALPMRVSPEVTNLYDRIGTLKSGDAVVMSFDYSPSGAGDITPQVEAILKHIATKEGVRVIALSFWAEGPVIADTMLDVYQAQGKEYGVDYINLGYCAGAESAIAKFAEDVTGAFPKDFKGMPTDSYPVMAGVKSAKDITLFIDFSAGSPGPREWIRQVQNQYGKEIAVGASSNLTATLTPYYDAKQLIAILNGLRGAAEYESLTKQLGKGSAGMGSQTLGHLLIIVFLVLGNIGFFASKAKRRREGERKSE